MKAAKNKKRNKRRKDQPKNPPKADSEPVNKVIFPNYFFLYSVHNMYFLMIYLGCSGGSCLCGSAQSG